MNVAASAPKLETDGLPTPGLKAKGVQPAAGAAGGAGQPTAKGVTTFPFLSILDWLTNDLSLSAAATKDPKESKDPSKKDKAARHDPQNVLPVELPKPAVPVKPPIVLEPAAIGGSTEPIDKAAAVAKPPQPEEELAAAAARAAVAFVAILTEHTPTPKEATGLAKATTTPQAGRENAPASLKELPPLKTAEIHNTQDFSPSSNSEHRSEHPFASDKAAAPDKLAQPVHLPEPQVHVGATTELVPIKTDRSQSPAPARAEHLETSKAESKTEINAAIRPQPTREIALRLTGPDAGSVDLKISERAGKVQVDVRTPDGELARSLRAELGDLVGRLEKRGFDAQTWTPGTQAAVAAGSSDRADTGSDQTSQQFPGGGGQHGQTQDQDSRQKRQERLEFVQQFETSMSFPEGPKENYVHTGH